MKYGELLVKLEGKTFFTTKDLADILAIKPQSAWVLASRYVKNGLFLRLKNNFYVMEESWRNLSAVDFFKIANFLQVPSYISFMSALSYYEVTTQLQRNFFESASLKRSRKFDIKETEFNFYKLKKQYYFDFVKTDGIFIAAKEKAFVDIVYLYSFGKYKPDFGSLDLNKLDKTRIKEIMKVFPQKTKTIIKKLCGI